MSIKLMNLSKNVKKITVKNLNMMTQSTQHLNIKKLVKIQIMIVVIQNITVTIQTNVIA